MMEHALEESFYQRLGILLADKRRRVGISQDQLAHLVGVHRNTILRWEKGDQSLDTLHLLRVADALGCTHLQLLPGREMVWGPLQSVPCNLKPLPEMFPRRLPDGC